MDLNEALNHLADSLRSSRDAKAFVVVVKDIDRLRAIEQRAATVAGEGAPALSVDPSPQQAAVTARYILGFLS